MIDYKELNHLEAEQQQTEAVFKHGSTVLALRLNQFCQQSAAQPCTALRGKSLG